MGPNGLTTTENGNDLEREREGEKWPKLEKCYLHLTGKPIEGENARNRRGVGRRVGLNMFKNPMEEVRRLTKLKGGISISGEHLA